MIKENFDLIGKPDNVTFISSDGTKIQKRDHEYGIIFIDPPYRKNLILPTLENIIYQNLISTDGLAVIEYASDEDIKIPDQFREIKMRKITFNSWSYFHSSLKNRRTVLKVLAVPNGSIKFSFCFKLLCFSVEDLEA